MAINLSRNTKVYFTTNVNATTGVVPDIITNYSNTNTFQIPVLDGFSFSQSTAQQTVQLSEAGKTPVRGQRAFNTQLDPVDWSFSSYLRPQLTAAIGPVSAAERVLWNALFGEVTLDTTGVSITSITRVAGTNPVIDATVSPLATIVTGSALQKTVNGVASAVGIGDVLSINGVVEPSFNQAAVITATNGTTYSVEYAIAPKISTTAVTTNAKAYASAWAQGHTTTAATDFSYVSTSAANKNQLQKFGLIFVVDNALYAIDNCAMDQCSIDFGLDTIAMAAWTGKGTALKQLATLTAAALGATTASTAASTKAAYITNKLSTLTLKSNIGGDQHTTLASVNYVLPLTGGNITIANNLTYQTPANLAVVNTPIGYYTGNRSVSGNVTAYLRTGGNNDAGTLLSKLLTDATTTAGVEPKYFARLEAGGLSALNRVEFEMPAVVLQIPAVDIADVISTTINFNAQGFDNNIIGSQTYDITEDNELIVRYYSNTSTA